MAITRRRRHALHQPGQDAGHAGRAAPRARSGRRQFPPALASLEDLAQLLALWRPGAYGKERSNVQNVQMFKMFKCSKSAPRSREYHSTSWLAPSQRI